jgi:hypothetical protein
VQEKDSAKVSASSSGLLIGWFIGNLCVERPFDLVKFAKLGICQRCNAVDLVSVFVPIPATGGLRWVVYGCSVKSFPKTPQKTQKRDKTMIFGRENRREQASFPVARI